MATIIEAHALEKSFSRRSRAPGIGGLLRSYLAGSRSVDLFPAVRALDFEIEEGCSLALIGPNGAGKSTTIKMLTGILFPTAGEARVLGLVPWRERTKLAMSIATVFGQRSQLWYDLPAGASFDLLARIYELRPSDYRERRASLIERFELGPLLGTSVRKLSLGQRMRCEIVASLLHRPRVLFLDEPTIGLDVLVKQEIRALIRELNKNEGVTVVLTSHDAGDVERLADRVLVINHGAVVFDNVVAALKRRYLKRKRIEIKLAEPPSEPIALEGVERKESSAFALVLEVDTDRQPIERVLSALVSRLAIADITIEDPPLEEIIAAIYRDRGSTERAAS
jgi:ABC-2 type transport system ATP-binding protein